jgi:hypothetical protein
VTTSGDSDFAVSSPGIARAGIQREIQATTYINTAKTASETA